MKRTICTALASAVLLILSGTALCGNTRSSRLSDWLTIQLVQDFAQDDRGYMWMATHGGLYKYNGYEFEHYVYDGTDSGSLPDDFVFSLLYDRDGVLWAGTGQGLCCLDSGTNEFTTYSTMDIYDIFQDKDGQIWAGTPDGPARLDRERGELVIDGDVRNVNIFWEDETGHIWTGSGENEALAMRKSEGNWEKFRLPGGRTVHSQYCAPDRIWWLGTDSGLAFFDPALRRFVDIPGIKGLVDELNGIKVNFIVEIESYKLLIGTEFEGLYYYDLISRELLHNRPVRFNPSGSSQLHCCYVDSDENVWIGSFDKGFVTANKQADYFNQDEKLSSLVHDKFVTRVLEDPEQNLWIGTRYNGIIRYGTDGKVTVFNTSDLIPGSRGDFIEVMYMTSDGRIWTAIESCLTVSRLHGDRLVPEVRLDLRNVRVIKEDSMGRLWLGTWNGLYRLEFKGGKPVLVDYGEGNVTDVFEDREGRIFVTSNSKGLYEVDVDNRTMTMLEIPSVCRDVTTACITAMFDSEGKLWCGSYKFGLTCIRPDGSAEVLTMNDGLPSNNVLCFQEDLCGNIWASTSNGIVKIVCGDHSLEFSTYNMRPILRHEQYHEKSGCTTVDGRVFFGGNHGLTFFDPDDIKTSKAAPKVNIDDISVIDESIMSEVKGWDTEPSITLDWKRRNINIDYSGIDFFTSNNLTYRCMLEGFDKKVSEVGTYRRASWSNLPPGKYIFKVWAVNDCGMESEEPAELTIRVLRAPWLSIPAMIGYVLILLILAYVVIRTTTNAKISRQKAEIEHNEKMREVEVSRMKSVFYANISHELRTPLTLIAAPSEQLLEDSGLNDKERRLVKVIHRNASRMMKMMNQLMDFAKTEDGVLKLHVSQENVQALIRAQYEAFSVWADKKSIRFLFLPGSTEEPVWADSDKIDKIMTNLLSNAMKHTPQGGSVVVSCRFTGPDEKLSGYSVGSGRYLEVSVKDSGPGVDKESMDQLFIRYPKIKGDHADFSGNGIGLHYTKKLTECHKGDIKAELCPEGGMKFSFIIPADDVYSDEEKRSVLQDYVIAPDDSDGVPVPEVSADENAPLLLIAEDNDDLRGYLKFILGKDYRVIAAADGDEAWAAVQEHCPDLVLSDVIMPKTSGIELCSMIKASTEFSFIPVVLLTAKNETADRIAGRSSGAEAYVSKPFNIEELSLTIANLLKSKEALRKYYLSPDVEGERTPAPQMSANDQKFMDKLTALVRREVSNAELDIESLTVELGISRSVFYKKLKGLTGMSPNDFVRGYRFKLAAQMINEGELSLQEIADSTGFNSYSYFSKSFKAHFGISPKDFRQKDREGHRESRSKPSSNNSHIESI